MRIAESWIKLRTIANDSHLQVYAQWETRGELDER
jgi:hypothetical protein